MRGRRRRLQRQRRLARERETAVAAEVGAEVERYARRMCWPPVGSFLGDTMRAEFRRRLLAEHHHRGTGGGGAAAEHRRSRVAIVHHSVDLPRRLARFVLTEGPYQTYGVLTIGMVW